MRRPLLVLECGADTLEKQKLSYVSHVPDHVRRHLGDDLPIIRARSRKHLQDELDRLKQDSRTFDVVLVIGHSSRRDLVAAQGDHVDWRTFGSWLAPLRPKVLPLVACRAGSEQAQAALFAEIKTLKLAYASPSTITKAQGLTLLALAATQALDLPHLDWLVRLIGFLSHGTITVAWSRQGMVEAQVVASILREIIDELVELAISLFGD